MRSADKTGNLAAWTGFLTVAFAALGLVGAFGTYAGQIPFDRAIARSQALDRALAASHRPDAQEAEDALRPQLDESAARVLQGPGTIEGRIAAERTRVLSELHAEAAVYGFRMRCYIATFTVMAALFGAMVMRFGRS